MKIRRAEIDGEQHLITPCTECCFYNEDGTCDFGRIRKYKAKGQTRHGPDTSGLPYEILTFCNHARPEEWKKDGELNIEARARVREDNRIKYDLIMRITKPEQVAIAKDFLKRETPPEHIIFSFVEIDIAEVVELAGDLDCSFELIQIKDESARTQSELRRVHQPWSETMDADKEWSLEMMDEFSGLINEDLEQIVAVTGEQYIIMTMLVVSFDVASLYFSFDNIEEIATMQKNTDNIRRFDGQRICNYS